MRAPSPRATRSRPDVDSPAGLDPTGLARTVELTPVRPPRPRWLV
ncbi:MAG: hypothetical protein QOI68_780, partial [Pseudonocardiales bacterium]|nr:hypothetical protein [Pseudonocardiales bacterium]